VAGPTRAPLLALAFLAACAGAPGPASTSPSPAPATSPVRPRAPATAPPSTGPFAPPDRTQGLWSQTPVRLLGIGEVEAGTAAGGASWRVGTARGAVWVWRPAGYRPRQAGVCVYLHGYFTTVDQAVADHRLAEQFAASGRNALFVVAEAPAWNGEDGVWPDLDGLLGETLRRIGLPPPPGAVVVVGHSGAFRPILGWLGHARLEEVLLLDGLYLGESQFKGWLQGAGLGPKRRLVLVSDETFPAAEALVATVPGAVSLPEVPSPESGLDGPARSARLIHLKSQHSHMAMVESGEVLPVLLRASHLPAIQ
jgi:hypothetical protein